MPVDDPTNGGVDFAGDLTACLDTVERLRRQDATTSESVSHAQAAVRSAHAKVAFWKSLKDSDQPAVSSLYRLMKLATEGGGTNLFDSARALATRYRAQGENVTQRAKAEEMLAWQAAGTFGSGFASGVGGILALPVTMPAGLAASLILALRLAASIAILAGEDPLSPRVAAEIMACAFGSEVIEEEEGAKQHDDGVLADVSARAPDAKNLGEYAAMRAAIALPRAFTVEAIKGVVGRAARVTAARVAASGAARTGAFATAAALPLLGGVVGGAIDSAFTATAGHRALARFFPASGDAAPGTAVAEQVEQARAAAAAWAKTESAKVKTFFEGWGSAVGSAFDKMGKGVDATLDGWAAAPAFPQAAASAIKKEQEESNANPKASSS